MVITGYKKDQDDRLFNKWIHDHTELSFEEYKKKHVVYRKSTQKEKDDILKRYLGG